MPPLRLDPGFSVVTTSPAHSFNVQETVAAAALPECYRTVRGMLGGHSENLTAPFIDREVASFIWEGLIPVLDVLRSAKGYAFHKRLARCDIRAGSVCLVRSVDNRFNAGILYEL